MRYLAAFTALALCLGIQSAYGEAAQSGANALGANDSRLPGFAAELAQQSLIASPAAWQQIPEALAWQNLTRASENKRQAARWRYARSLIAQERGGEAFGVLEVMVQDDPDLALVDNFRLARGAALTLLHRPEEALESLGSAMLVNSPEACAWRLRALVDARHSKDAYASLPCARPVLGAKREPAFLRAAAQAALEEGHPELTLEILAPLSNRDASADLLRARAQQALKKYNEARLSLAMAERTGTEAEKIDAQLIRLEAQVAAKTLSPRAAVARIDVLRYGWRGDATEERALLLGYRLSKQAGDISGQLRNGATLFRYFDVARYDPEFVPTLRQTLNDALDPARKLPLAQAAGLYWDYRDLAPSGVEGDKLARRLADTLQAAGLYGRAADLLNYQLFVRAGDLARGPLSIRVASLYVLDGRPARALKTLKQSDDPSFSNDMIAQRKQVEAVALSQLGRGDEAMAVLDGVPDSAALGAAILWKRHDWQGYATATENQLAAPQSLDTVGQAAVLRHVIALAMIGREDRLAAMRSRYQDAFSQLPTWPVFDMLTATPVQVDPAALSKAMAALPSANPAGEMGELLDSAPDKPLGDSAD